MQLKNTVENILKNQLSGSPFYIVDVLTSQSKIRKKITVLVDSDEGIKIDECSTISRNLGDELEEIVDEAFTLEVSSPGVDTPLKLERQYVKNIGRKLKVLFNDGKEIKGDLVSVADGAIVLQPEKIKKITPEPVKIEQSDIKEAKVVITFK
ncbi:ribosome maturation factor RimP [Emticicia sp. CRIBPO]|uniref:ribosome maturation factor RimP n=1 Tax=Emticicia sp. CRIBPO TaxID=2683258 RepID=UPI0014128DDD|nr:ribosome maturation factor RimP [Emticicia sp. CRIBPO]NBA86200.1 ribosome maturation factor RimP [Emticicia sp. CRIBPO]